MTGKNEISIVETLQLMDGKFYNVFKHFSQGEYAFWLGSAISKERVIGLDGVLSKLLEFLRSRVTQDADCLFRKSLNDVLKIANLSAQEAAQIDLEQPADKWLCINAIIDKLWNSYSDVLSVRVGEEPLDYLLWDGLDFKATFANQEPDLEHLAIGMLVLEGIVKDIATANWDGLLEAAMRKLGHEGTGYQVTVTGQDLQGPEACAKLYKFHGCALRAIDDEDNYRKLLVARDAQIIGWLTNDNFKMVREQLHSLLQRRKTLMIGLSAQDSNIKTLFGGVGEGKFWQWDNSPTPIVISSKNVGNDQKTLLNVTYGPEAFEEHEKEILDRAAIPAYSKTLLTALLLDILTKKLVTLACDANAPKLTGDDRERVCFGLEHLRNRTAQAGQSNSRNLVEMIALTTARARHQLQDGESPTGPLNYYPLDNAPIHLMQGKQALSATGMREAAAALGMVGLADQKGEWAVTVDDPKKASSGALRLTTQHATSRVFLAANDHVITELINCGAFSEDDTDAVVVCSKNVSSRQQRNPSANLRGARSEPRIIPFGPMLEASEDVDSLYDRFRKEVAI